jgi:hypothetical protein
MPEPVLNGKKIKVPEKTEYDGYILKKPKSLISDKKPLFSLFRYYCLIYREKTDKNAVINEISDFSKYKINMVLKKVRYDDLNSYSFPIIKLKRSYVIFLKKSNYGDNAYVFDGKSGYVFVFKKDFLRYYSGEIFVRKNI